MDTNQGSRNTGSYKAIFSVCNCLDAGTNFVAGHRIGIRLTILVNGQAGENGAYWSDPASANVQFGLFPTIASACSAEAYTTEFGPGKFFKSDQTTEVTTLIADPDCDVPSDNQATVIVTDPDQGYTITGPDETNKLSRWWINIPEIRIDPSVLHNGEKISVKIETLDQSTGGICALCVATCECIIDVAFVCPAGSSTSSCLFPYFTSTTAATAESPYWNGIAIVNTSSTAGTATLTVHQKDGTIATFTTPEIAGGSMFVSALEGINFDGNHRGNRRAGWSAALDSGRNYFPDDGRVRHACRFGNRRIHGIPVQKVQ